MLSSLIMNSLLFPPKTNEVQFDEKWSFVGKKERNCDLNELEDMKYGDNWDHVAFDPEHRLVIFVVPGKRTAKNVQKLVREFKMRTEGRLMRLITTDKYLPYKDAILTEYSEIVCLTATGKPGRPRKPFRIPLSGLNYAMVKKHLKKGKVSKVETEIVFGTKGSVEAALMKSKSSRKINTSFIERQNGTDRHRNARKIRKSLCFSKECAEHEAMTFFTMYNYNFCWPVRTLRICELQGGRFVQRTPAMAAGITDHVWTMKEWATFPVVQCT